MGAGGGEEGGRRRVRGCVEGRGERWARSGSGGGKVRGGEHAS